MILNNAPQNEAIVSNVAEIGEFRIRNSAKAFSILSSGLYANKIRAIIRELSCNAVDSHTAAGREGTPFDVHLPNTLSPYFSIRDYGTGLSHEQVTQIYTTYFESTKTNSNAFIGALGLGSKSPFSYTDNFTVTAIKDGVKGIYSAFINGEGVPSIALMMQEETTDPSGVEVKFSVNESYDFGKFRDEARHVYTHFKLRPVVSGSTNFEFRNIDYDTMDIIPGVHSINGSRGSVAVMGNIAYPVEVPQSERDTGGYGKETVYSLIGCGLEMHFGIGELDFQASREGLSYIPQTVDAIKAKLEAVNGALTKVLAKEADAIENLWERALFLNKKKEHVLWRAAVSKYIKDTNFSLLTEDRGYIRLSKFEFKVADLTNKYNIQILSFSKNRGNTACSTTNASINHIPRPGGAGYDTENYWPITVGDAIHFVVNDTKIGAVERAKYHWRTTSPASKDIYSQYVYVLQAADRTKPMDTDAFFKDCMNPPECQKHLASGLSIKDRAAGVAKNVTIMKLMKKGYGGYYRENELVWKDAGKVSTFDDTKPYYYMPLSGFTSLGKYSGGAHALFADMQECGIKLGVDALYGVRKTDIEDIKKRPNWVNIEDHLSKVLPLTNSSVTMQMVIHVIDSEPHFKYNYSTMMHVPSDSPYAKLVSQFKDVTKTKFDKYALKKLCAAYASNVNISPDALIEKYTKEVEEMHQRYPLLKSISASVTGDQLAGYINMVDTFKKEGK